MVPAISLAVAFRVMFVGLAINTALLTGFVIKIVGVTTTANVTTELVMAPKLLVTTTQ